MNTKKLLQTLYLEQTIINKNVTQTYYASTQKNSKLLTYGKSYEYTSWLLS